MNTLGKPKSTVTLPVSEKSDMWAMYGIGLVFVIMMALCIFLVMGLGTPQI